MKKLICLIILLCCLCGCSDIKQDFSLNTDSLNTSFSMKTDELEIKGKMIFDSEMNMALTVTYPQNISGLKFDFNADTVTASFDGVCNTYKKNELPDEFIFMNVFNLIQNAVNQGGFIRNSDSSYEATSNGIKLIADKQGNITSATLKNGYILFNK